VAHVGNSRPSLGNPATGAAEQLVALKFLLHVMGDDTTSHCTEHSVVTGIVPRNSPDNGSFDAALGRGGS
jgi:hypothetical protein